MGRRFAGLGNPLGGRPKDELYWIFDRVNLLRTGLEGCRLFAGQKI